MSKDNAIHASIHKSDKDIGQEKTKEAGTIGASWIKKVAKDGNKVNTDNTIHASIHKSDRDIG